MTRERLTQAIKDALAAVEDAGVPDDLREIAFTRTLDHLLGGSPASAPRPLAGGGGGGPESGAGDADPSDDDALSKIARKLDIDASTAARVFDIEEDDVYIVPARGKFGRARMTATQQIATLVAAGRQAAGFDADWTKAASVRAVADQKDVLDESNFGQAIGRLSDQGMRIRGTGRNREIKVLDTGFEAAGNLVRELASAE